MPDNQTTVVAETQREVEATNKPNFDLLSNDNFLNENVNNQVETKTEAETTKEEPVNQDLALEAEKKEEVTTEIKEENKEEVKAEETKEETPLELEPLELDNQKESQGSEDGSWKSIAEFEGLSIENDDYDSFRNAIVEKETASLKQEIETIRSLTQEELLKDLNPEARMVIELTKAGMKFEDIVNPFVEINAFKAMEPQALVRKNLELSNPEWTPEMVDMEMENLAANPAKLDFEHKKVIIELDRIMNEEKSYRENLIKQHRETADKVAYESKRQSVDSTVKALDNMPKFMGQPLSKELKQGLTERINSGKYDSLFNDPIKRAEFIMYHELGAKAEKRLVDESYAKGKAEVTKLLHNIPPITSSGAGKSTTNNNTNNGTSNFDKLNNDKNIFG